MRAHVDVRDSNLTFFARGTGVSVGVGVGVGVGFEGAFFIVLFVFCCVVFIPVP